MVTVALRKGRMSNKVYVDVIAEFKREGLLKPLVIKWKDGRV